MIGIVEVYRDGKLIDSGNNLILDGFAEVITDAMTVIATPSSMSNSSILDASNYTLQGASFAKGASGYLMNAHSFTNPITVSGRTASPTIVAVTGVATVSSYYPSGSLVSYPTPMDRMLEVLPSSVQSLIRTYGQNLNVLQYWSQVSATSSLGTSGALALGCYPSSVALANRQICAIYTTGSSLIVSGKIGGTAGAAVRFNGSTSTMDWRGYMERSRNTATLQGFVLSDVSVNAPLGIVDVVIAIGYDDLNMANLYGGIYSIGLWCFDLPKAASLGNYPPLPWSPIDPKMEYKLVAKRVFNDNIAKNQDNGSNAGLTGPSTLTTIKWRLIL